MFNIYIYIYILLKCHEALDAGMDVTMKGNDQKGDDQNAVDPEAQKVASSQAKLEGTGLEGTKLDEGTKPHELWPHFIPICLCLDSCRAI